MKIAYFALLAHFYSKAVLKPPKTSSGVSPPPEAFTEETNVLKDRQSV